MSNIIRLNETAPNVDNADVNGDGKINVKDVLALRKTIVNITE